MDFGFISISDSRINKNKQSVVDISIPYHIFELCPTESSASGNKNKQSVVDMDVRSMDVRQISN